MNELRAAEGQPRIQRILVATDFSVQADRALQWARTLAEAFQAQISVLHVIDVFGLGEISNEWGGPDPLPLLREQSRRYMTELKMQVPDAETLIREGSPRPAIVELALELHCDLVVMGTHGRSGLKHLVLGSVAEYVVRHSVVPVFTVRTREHRV